MGEAVVAIVVIGIFLAIVLPNYVKDWNRKKNPDAETKANCHTIQIALERFYTDNGEYPAYLLGGDPDGWKAWHQKWDGANEIVLPDGRISSNEIVVDPLLDQNYLSSYPFNPYTSNGSKIIRRTSVEGYKQQGVGDPRFGYKGNVMAMCLDDPNYFASAVHPGPFIWSEIETRRTLDRGDYMNVPDEFKNSETNMYYTFGGFRDPKSPDKTVQTHWPGNFFYRSFDDRLFQDLNSSRLPYVGEVHPNRYILGGYGAEGNAGQDVIRMTEFDDNGDRIKWRFDDGIESEFEYCGFGGTSNDGSASGLPEVFGHGERGYGPRFPYFSEENPDEFLYGAPDGIPDGVIIVLTDGPEKAGFAI